MSRYELFDVGRVELLDLAIRGHDLVAAACLPLQPLDAPYVHPELESLISDIRAARGRGSPVVVMMGGHPIKLGLSRFLVDLIERGWITHLAMNGEGIIHDFELALVGGTSENVAKWIQARQFGLWRETGQLNEIAKSAADRGEGFGEAVGRVVEDEQFSFQYLSLAAAGWRCNVPVTVHVSMGSDILHSHPNCDGAAIGQVSYTDFRIFAETIRQLEGGVFLNIGSAVTGPEVYLKALSMSRNVARQNTEIFSASAGFPQGQDISCDNSSPKPKSIGLEPRNFTTAVLDLVSLPPAWRHGTPSNDEAFYYYRPWKTILIRTIADGGRSFYFQGNHRQTIPTLWHRLATAH